MIDFLRANTFVTKDDYQWSWSVPQIKLANKDFTYVKNLSEKQSRSYWAKKKMRGKNYDNLNAFTNDLGLPVFD